MLIFVFNLGSMEEEPDMILADILFQMCQDGKKNPVCVTKTKNLLNVIKKMSDLVRMYPELIRMLKFLFLMANSDKVDEKELVGIKCILCMYVFVSHYCYYCYCYCGYCFYYHYFWRIM